MIVCIVVSGETSKPFNDLDLDHTMLIVNPILAIIVIITNLFQFSRSFLQLGYISNTNAGSNECSIVSLRL